MTRLVEQDVAPEAPISSINLVLPPSSRARTDQVIFSVDAALLNGELYSVCGSGNPQPDSFLKNSLAREDVLNDHQRSRSSVRLEGQIRIQDDARLPDRGEERIRAPGDVAVRL
jgi:hypothetical protein